MLLMLDNYDSFTFNLVQYFMELGEKVEVRRNDMVTVEDIENLKPDRIVVSPGPCDPEKAGISVEVVKHFAGKIPLMGVCLGHQSIGYAFGAQVVRSPKLMHGKTSMVHHDGRSIFKGIENPFEANRYHSLILKRDSIPDSFEISAWTDSDEVMGIRHKEYAVEGVQFHPESILTVVGKDILKNFLEITS